jgi:predicted O-methyltransferase YrrM
MHSVRHWTPRYLFDRASETMYRRRHPGQPWLTKDAVAILSDLLRPSDVGLEFGSGRSTVWFARRVAELTSVEHDREWYAKTSTLLRETGFTNVHYLLREMDREEGHGVEAEYVRVASTFEPNSLDFVLVDGVYRGDCANAAIPRLRPGGVLIVDNINWFIPSGSRAPNSCTTTQGCDFVLFEQTVRDWRRVWTSDGINDTALFVKPC